MIYKKAKESCVGGYNARIFSQIIRAHASADVSKLEDVSEPFLPYLRDRIGVKIASNFFSPTFFNKREAEELSRAHYAKPLPIELSSPGVETIEEQLKSETSLLSY